MAVKLLIHILIIAVVVIFFGLNYETKIDINLGFITLNEIRLFTALAVSYLLGLFTFIPFTILKQIKKRKKNEKKEILTTKSEDE